MSRLTVLLFAAAVLLAACGGGGEVQETCHPSGTKLTIAAENLQFDKGCLAAPANKPFTITFDNADGGQAHNVSIYQGGSEVFKGEIFTGVDTMTYDVQAIPPGTYEFKCDTHPDQMTGTFIVE